MVDDFYQAGKAKEAFRAENRIRVVQRFHREGQFELSRSHTFQWFHPNSF